jgi:hypothetical protein
VVMTDGRGSSVVSTTSMTKSFSKTMMVIFSTTPADLRLVVSRS